MPAVLHPAYPDEGSHQNLPCSPQLIHGITTWQYMG